jgi:hypothetical protein
MGTSSRCWIGADPTYGGPAIVSSAQVIAASDQRCDRLD